MPNPTFIFPIVLQFTGMIKDQSKEGRRLPVLCNKNFDQKLSSGRELGLNFAHWWLSVSCREAYGSKR